MVTIVPKNASVTAGIIFALTITLVGIFAPLLAPHDPTEISVLNARVAPAEDLTYLLGTDIMGRDMLSRVIYSFRFYVISGALAMVMGTCAAWLLVSLRSTGGTDTGPRHLPLGGVLSRSILRLSSQTFVIGLFLGIVIVIVGIVGIVGSWSLQLVIYTGVVSAILPLSLVYQSVQMALGSRARLEQTSLLGEGPAPSPIRLALARGFALAPVSFSLAVLMALFIETAISFVGFGVPPGDPSLGIILREGSMVPLRRLVAIPGLVILIAIGAFMAIALPIE